MIIIYETEEELKAIIKAAEIIDKKESEIITGSIYVNNIKESQQQ